ncbi:hypothetical protein [Pseudothauera rhizosphaerae]|uniref:Uncharacterized protein n=1 Tax=Pseudothauera rhizosphaerae TaxID=2565932 RepID=A0A4S4ASP3_9RHOO|nr:hypothetical protein [Pseudothauera rhizosphaerae]THF62188.1 hypothetical protein E6O51_08535 [Pseudothauera rhizosphaerae]
MHANKDARDWAGGTDGGLFPPFEDGGVRAPSWDRQLAAAQAWQDAGGNGGGEACQWRAQRAAGATPALTMRTIVRLNTLNLALRARLTRIASDMSDVAIAAMQAHQDANPDQSAARGVEVLDHAGAARLAGMVRDWYAILANAQADMSALTGIAPARAERSQPLVERRQRAVPIDFAERRKAG